VPRRAIGLRIAIRFLAGASRRAIERLQRTVVHASKIACPPAADPQPALQLSSTILLGEWKLPDGS
jgi:hypothetical protein